jgi:hypothetical protein
MEIYLAFPNIFLRDNHSQLKSNTLTKPKLLPDEFVLKKADVHNVFNEYKIIIEHFMSLFNNFISLFALEIFSYGVFHLCPG